MILVDSCVVIDYLRRLDPRMLTELRQRQAAVCGVIRAELLHGAGSPIARPDLLDVIDSFHQLPMPESLWDDIGDNLASLRAAGIAMSLSDVAIATLAMSEKIALWTYDRAFERMQAVIPKLRVVWDRIP